MLDHSCPRCEELWAIYRTALMDHIRISGKFKLEVLIGNAEFIERVRVIMLAAEAERLRARQEYHAHQAEHTSGHAAEIVPHGPENA